MKFRCFLTSVVIILILQLCLSSCKREYEYNTAYVYKTGMYHWGRGFFKLRIHYSFECNDSIYQGCVKTPGLYEYKSESLGRFKVGDTVFVKYPAGKPEKSELANYKVRRKKVWK